MFYYLASGELKHFYPTKCTFSKKITYLKDTNFMLISLIPPIHNDVYLGLHSTNIDHLIIASRHSDNSLFAVKRWPVSVNICLINNKSILTDDSNTLTEKNDITNQAWGELYQDFDSAYKDTIVQKQSADNALMERMPFIRQKNLDDAEKSS
ncbi:MAG: hypothetical protein WCP97_01560 [bacterium]